VGVGVGVSVSVDVDAPLCRNSCCADMHAADAVRVHLGFARTIYIYGILQGNHCIYGRSYLVHIYDSGQPYVHLLQIWLTLNRSLPVSKHVPFYTYRTRIIK